MSDILTPNDLDQQESAVRAAVTGLLETLRAYKTELSKQEKKLRDAQALKLDQLSDANAASVISSVTKRLEENSSELASYRRKCNELEEKNLQLESNLQSKSRHIEKLSSLLLHKEEKIQTLEDGHKEAQERLNSLESLLERRKGECEKWKSAAQQAAQKMQEQLSTLKASENMNQDLRNLLDKEIHKYSSNSQDEIEASLLPSSVTGATLNRLNTSSITVNRAVSPHYVTVSPPSSGTVSVRYAAVTDAVTEPASPQFRTVTPANDARSPHFSTVRATSPLGGAPYRKLVTFDDDPAPPRSVTVTKVTPVVEYKSSVEIEEKKFQESPRGSPLVVHQITSEESPSTSRIIYKLGPDGVSSSPASSPGGTLPYPTPVPTFSRLVSDALEGGRIHDPVIWKYFIRECVHFYYDLLPNSDAAVRNSYFNIGRTLYDKYPAIAKEGPNFKTPWTYFNTCLSSRLRNERFIKKRQNEKRSQFTPVTEPDRLDGATEPGRIVAVEPDRRSPEPAFGTDNYGSKRARFSESGPSVYEQERGCRL